MTRLIITIALLQIAQVAVSQNIIGLGTRWDDSFREWEVYTTNENNTGTLEMRWPLKDDWTEWDMRLGDTTASFRYKWPDDPNMWEIKSLGVTVTARTTWPGNFRQWKLSDGTNRITWTCRYGNATDEWVMRDQDNGSFSVYTYYRNDPRDWVIDDQLDEEVSFAMRLTMIFIAIWSSVPKV